MEQLVKKTALVSVLTLVSRILGMVRDAVIAMVFGGTMASDLFFLAFRPFDLMRKMFANGFLTLSFIPIFSRHLSESKPQGAAGMISSCLAFAGLASAGLILAGFFWTDHLVLLMAPGLGHDPGAIQTTMGLLRTMLPYFWIIITVSLASAVLQCLGNFHLPALAPALFNLVFILFALLAGLGSETWIPGLAFGVTAGGLAQLCLVLPRLLRTGLVQIRQVSFSHPGMGAAGKKMLPCMVGAGAFHLNVVAASVFASHLPEGSVSCLYYADRLVQFPMGLIAVSLSTVLLPLLSRQSVQEGQAQVRRTFEQGVRLGIFITLPAMAGLLALAEPVVTLLFGRGAFDGAAIARTTECLVVLVSGLWAMAGVQLLSILHFGLGRIRYPFYAGLFAMGLNLGFCWVFMPIWGVQGLALAVSLAAAGGCLFLFFSPLGKGEMPSGDGQCWFPLAEPFSYLL